MADSTTPDEVSVEGSAFRGYGIRVDDVFNATAEGEAELVSNADFRAFIGALHDAACAPGVAGVRLDLRALEVMGSTGFAVLVTWLARLEKLPPEARYQVRLFLDPTVRWQASAPRQLAGFARGLLSFEP